MNRAPLALGVWLWIASSPLLAQQLSAIGFVDLEVAPGFSLIANPLGTPDNTVSALFRGVRRGVPEGTTLFKLIEAGATNAPLSEDLGKALVEGVLSKLPASVGGSVSIRLENGNVVLEWTGTLQTAAEAAGSYEAVDPARSPLQLAPSQARQFWRSQIRSSLSAAQFAANIFRAGEWTDPGQTLMPGEGAILFNPGPEAFVLSFDGQILGGRLTNPIPAHWSLRANMLPLTGGLSSDAGLELSPGDGVFLWDQGSFSQFTYRGGKSWFPFEPQIGAAKAFFIFANQPTVWEQDFSVDR